MALRGRTGEHAVYNAMKTAVDPYNPQQCKVRNGIYKGSGNDALPLTIRTLGKPIRSCCSLAARQQPASGAAAGGQDSAVERAGNCVLVTEHIDGGWAGHEEADRLYMPNAAGPMGAYTITRNFNIMTDAQSSGSKTR